MSQSRVDPVNALFRLLYGTEVMPATKQALGSDAQSQAVTSEAALSLTQDLSRPASLARAAQPSTFHGLLGVPLILLRAGTLSAKLLLSGGVAGAVSRTATAPIDRLKFILQVQDGQLITVRQVLSMQFAAACSDYALCCNMHACTVSALLF